MMLNKSFCIGLMSGTSLDGLDICYCSFSKDSHTFNYDIIHSKTYVYNDDIKLLLSNFSIDALSLVKVNNIVGLYFANFVISFIEEFNIKKIDFISSHGHTFFHDPSNSLTFQAGSGAVISARCNIPVVCDFRALDVALGGQGAPLVPIGDNLLFSSFDFCLNLGGISNISVIGDSPRAFDICPVNQVLNFYANKEGYNFDDLGNLARSGQIQYDLLSNLDGIEFYKRPFTKSLGREWVETEFLSICGNFSYSNLDFLRTITEHISRQISTAINQLLTKENTLLLATGGGVYNSFLIELINNKLDKNAKLFIPDNNLINFKEALIFAFLGYLRWHNQVNTLNSVTGAVKNSVGGCIYIN